MAVKKLNQKEQWYADTREEAEDVVETGKEDKHLTMHKITGKSNKFGPYFLVDLTYTYSTPKEIMEEVDAAGPPDGQISMDEVEQQEEEFDQDSIQFEEEVETVPQATESDLPF